MTVYVRLAMALAVSAASLLLTACGGGSDSPPPDKGSSETTVWSPKQLAAALVIAGDLEGDWTPWHGFDEWPGGKPGVIPKDQRPMIPTIEFCSEASEESVKAAASLTWQAYAQLDMTTPDPRANMVAVQEFLLSADPAEIETTFNALRDGMKACLGKETKYPDGEVGRTQAMEVPAYGDDRYAQRNLLDEPGGRAVWDGRYVLIREGTTLKAIQMFEIVIGKSAAPLLDDKEIEAIITTIAKKMP